MLKKGENMAKMTREEVISHFRNRPRESEDYTDVFYYTTEVDACEISVDGKRYLVPKSVGQAVLEVVENPSKNNEMVPLGNIEFRAYMVKLLKFRKAKFKELNEWSKAVILEEQPDLFEKWENKFSPELKKEIDKLRVGSKGKELKALPSVLVLE